MERDNLKMMKSPLDWPRWPILPLKRPGHDGPSTGILVAWEDHLTTVFLANMFDLGTGSFEEVFGSLEQIEYADYEAILDAGWRVD